MHPGPDTLDPVAARLASVVLSVMKGTQNEVMHVTAELDLSLSQLRTMFVIDHAEEPLAVNQIAEALGLSMPATGRAIDALVRTGLVSRTEDAVDRRVKRIALTDLGTAAITRIAEARLAAVRQLVDSLSPDEREAVDTATATLNEIVARHLPSHPQFCARPAAAAADGSTPNAQEPHA